MILQEIIAHKRQEVSKLKAIKPIAFLEQSIYMETPCISLSGYLNRPMATGIIAEFKRKSPSRGFINQYAEVEEVSIGYMQSGASGLSILTDEKYFGGSNSDLITARNFNFCPILRKDFIVDEYQIFEARAIGADVILLIASCLSKEQVLSFSKVAKGLGMEVLLEIHEAIELNKWNPNIDLIGVNNRDLKTFDVHINQSLKLINELPAESVPISESGISKPEDLLLLREAGFKGFLMGTHFMRQADPAQSCRRFVHEVEVFENNSEIKTAS